MVIKGTPKPGLYDDLLTQALVDALQALDADRLRIRDLERGEGAHRLAVHLRQIAGALVRAGDSAEALYNEADRVNGILTQLLGGAGGEQVTIPPQLLTGIAPPAHGVGRTALPDHPVIPLSEAELLVNAPGQPSMGQLIRQECASSTRVDLICAFIGPHGVHTLIDALEEVTQRCGPGSVRVITSTWLGATQRSALDMLSNLGAQVFVAYEGQRLRLHAKSWTFHRPGGLTTAYVGSSNISHHALETALEWNVRLSQRTNPAVIDRICQTFEAYLAGAEFEEYLPERDRARLDEALARARGSKGPRRLEPSDEVLALRPRPFAYQQRILDTLEVERTRHNRHRNLIVAATGTGKTVIAAFDYVRLAAGLGGLPSLLFVAHRREILEQSRNVFRSVLGRPQFGEILSSDGPLPTGQHVFAMVQSLHGERLRSLASDAYEIVIVDEFHHAEAPTYDRLLRHLAPKELVGLTATPERADGGDILRWFDGRIAAELRLWEAIDQGLLSPFHYFGVTDETQLAQLAWSRGDYDTAALSNVLTGNDARVITLIRAIDRYVPNHGAMRALGFCVSVEHARFMARQFTSRGIESAVITGDTPQGERQRLLAELRRGSTLRCIFSVDVLGEGVDVPDVDTLLLLRPTQSATVFLQQLGRGLRLSEGKSALTVLDLVAVPHHNFRFDRTLRTMLDPAGGSVRQQAEQGFPYLPSGCEIVFERDAHERVLKSLRQAVGQSRWKRMVEDLRAMPATTSLQEFLAATDREPEHLYYDKGRNWSVLRADAGHAVAPASERTRALRDNLFRLLHVDDEERAPYYCEWVLDESPPNWAGMSERHRRLVDMLLAELWGQPKGRQSRVDLIASIWSDRVLCGELRELLALLDLRATSITEPYALDGENPLRVHGQYTREEALIAFGYATFERRRPSREGVVWMLDVKTDCFFVTLRKDEKVFSPSTRYHDYAMSPSKFHWESQSTTSSGSPTAERYVTHRDGGSDVALFVRETRLAGKVAAPFTFLGKLRYESHRGSAPMQFVWGLESPMPAGLYEVARLVSG